MKKPRAPRGAPNTAPTPARAPGYDDLLAIARLIEAGSRFTEFRLRSGDIEVEVKRANGEIGPRPSAATAAAGATTAAGASAVTPAKAGASAVTPAKAEVQSPLPELPPGTRVIESPMVGTFYRAPEPGAKPFVEPGQKVKPDTIVCIIEVMKLMNSVEAGIAGTVTHVFVENAAVVEAGQPLIAVRP
jgi:acetyl-CoA carboxylase biotin carboxyl carrier protein